MEDDRDREEAIVDYKRYVNRSGVSNVTAFASVRLLSHLDEFDTDNDALSVIRVRPDLGRKGRRKTPFFAGVRMGHWGCPVHVQVRPTGIFWKVVFRFRKLIQSYFLFIPMKTDEGYLHAAPVPQSTRCPSYGS